MILLLGIIKQIQCAFTYKPRKNPRRHHSVIPCKTPIFLKIKTENHCKYSGNYTFKHLAIS